MYKANVQMVEEGSHDTRGCNQSSILVAGILAYRNSHLELGAQPILNICFRLQIVELSSLCTSDRGHVLVDQSGHNSLRC